MKCKVCGRDKPVEVFVWSRKCLGTRRNKCQTCNRKIVRDWYIKHKRRHIAHATYSRRARGLKTHKWIVDYLLTHPCVDCGEADIRVLSFDHMKKRSKRFTIGCAIGHKPLSVIQREIAKCAVRCANCHFKRHTRYSIRSGLVTQLEEHRSSKAEAGGSSPP